MRQSEWKLALRLPELRGSLGQFCKDPVQFGLVDVSPPGCSDIMNGRIRGEVVRDSQCLNFFSHGCSVFESSLRFVSIPIRYEDGTNDGRKHVGKKRSVLDTEATSKCLQHALHHVVGHVGGGQTRYVTCIDHEFLELL